MNINQATTELMKIFDIFNYTLFEDELPEPIITIQSSCKKFVNGWFTPEKVWSNSDGTSGKNEIAIIAERLNRPPIEIAETVLHEMVHYFNNIHEIKDANGQIHNKKFKQAAEDHGLNVEKFGKLGWALTSFNDKGKEIAETMAIDADAFSMYRVPVVKPEKEKKPSFKYTCPECGNKFTIKLEIQAICECGCEFEMEEKG